MAVVGSPIEEMLQRSGSRTLSNGTVEVTHTRVFKVHTSGVDNDTEVLTAVGIDIGAKYPTDNSSCIQVTASLEAAYVWVVTCNYSSAWNPDQINVNPFEARPRISVDWQNGEEIADRDINDNPCINRAGDPFDPPKTRPLSSPIIRITRAEPTFDPLYAGSYRNVINKDSFLGYDPFCVMVNNITAVEAYHDVVGAYYDVTYEFAVNPASYLWRPLNAGLRVQDETSDSGYRLIYIDGQPVTSPVPLDEDGRNPLTPPITADSAIYLEFHILNETDFSVFNFDPSTFRIT